MVRERHIEWTCPAPLWYGTIDPADVDARRAFRTPAILRFATDTFMDDLLATVAVDPPKLAGFVAKPERWDQPPGEPAIAQPKAGLMLQLDRLRATAVRKLEARGVAPLPRLGAGTSRKTLKLFQPAHQRHYLVSACLVCRVVGLPDRKVDPGVQERPSYVIRMLQPRAGADAADPDPKQCEELSLVAGAWQAVTNPETLVAGEQKYPLSPIAYTEDDGRSRRLFIGNIPVAQREGLLAAAQPAAATLPPLIDARQMLLKTKLFEPWSKLEDIANAAFAAATVPNPDPSDPTKTGTISPGEQTKIISRTNDQIQNISWFILRDFAKWLEQYLPQTLAEIQTPGSVPDLPGDQNAIVTTVANATANGTTFREALKKAYAASDALDANTTAYSTTAPGGTTGWPAFRFQFVMVSLAGVTGLSPNLDRKVFEPQVVAPLPPQSQAHTPPLPVRLTAQAGSNPQAPVWFTIRCIFEQPNCGSLTPPLVSEPTQAFQMAAFFDPEAPARPIRIGLPVDTTPAGLSKFDKNTAFVMSDVLCGQVKKMSGMTLADLILSVLPFPFHKDLGGGGGTPCTDDSGLSAGMVCSFSIPIITIVALILLIIFVKLLDIIFFWLPFFQICLPLPKFTAKES